MSVSSPLLPLPAQSWENLVRTFDAELAQPEIEGIPIGSTLTDLLVIEFINGLRTIGALPSVASIAFGGCEDTSLHPRRSRRGHADDTRADSGDIPVLDRTLRRPDPAGASRHCPRIVARCFTRLRISCNGCLPERVRFPGGRRSGMTVVVGIPPSAAVGRSGVPGSERCPSRSACRAARWSGWLWLSSSTASWPSDLCNSSNAAGPRPS